jgi:hypothetical protein
VGATFHWAAGVITVYLAVLFGVHRWSVARRVKTAQLEALRRLDWQTLLTPLGDVAQGARAQVVASVVAGAPVDAVALVNAGFDARAREWLTLLSAALTRPREALATLRKGRLETAAAVYLREQLELLHEVDALNLELAVYASKRRLAAALQRFGDAPALYCVRAFASARVGQNAAALDDLARAVYHSGQAPFFVRLVLDSPYVAKARPELRLLCEGAAGGAVAVR